MVDGIAGLGRGHMVRFRTDAADAGGDSGQLLHGMSLAELLKSPQLGHLKVHIGHITGLVQKDLDLAVTLQPSDGIDSDPFHFKILLRRIE